MNLDEKTLMLLQMIVLYSHDKSGLNESDKVSSFQVRVNSFQVRRDGQQLLGDKPRTFRMVFEV